MTALQMFINRERVPSSDGATEPVTNPVTEESIACVPRATREDVDRGVEPAAAAFSCWARATPAARSRTLLKLADRIESCVAELESRNIGKPLEIARENVEFAVDNLRFFCRGGPLHGGPSVRRIRHRPYQPNSP